MLATGEQRCARIALSGPVAPHVMDGVDPALLGRDLLPRVREATEVLNARTTNWSIVPCPTPGWASLVYPNLESEAALDRLWEEIAHVCRLDEPDPVAAWNARLDRLTGVCAKLDTLRLLGDDRIRRLCQGAEAMRGIANDAGRDRGDHHRRDRDLGEYPDILQQT